MTIDLSNPFHQASLYVEQIKYGRAPGRLVGATKAEITGDVEAILRDAGVTSLTGRDVVEACDFYAASYAQQFGIRQIVTKTMFLDGVLHGIALSGGLKGEPRP